jgi:hypothetical protein
MFMKKLLLLTLLIPSLGFPLQWERVTSGWDNLNSARLEVPSGWIVCAKWNNAMSSCVLMADQEHKWKLDS